MKVSLNWLRDLVELPPTVDGLVSLLTLAGVEVEGITTTGCAIPKVVAAQIKSSEQHPNADRLSVCQVDDGSGTLRQIVCGAKNFRVEDKVPLALPGADLGGGFVIKVGKLRGVESQGMLCSADELGLPASAGFRGAEDGLLILPPDTAVGTPIAELFAGDTVLDLEITPNRPDLLSVNGIAREIGTLLGKPVKLVAPKQTLTLPTENTIQITATESPLYTARKISGVKVGASPEWLRRRLEAVGLRPINNVVDITNYVMLELGQPLHAFDAAKLNGALNVRLAKEGEEFLALDGKTYKLATNQLVIADAAKAVAIAGVMGGEETGVTEGTTDLWLESALFEARSVRRTARTLGLSSDSSYRFERGVNPEGIAAASERATELILELAGGAAEAPLAGHHAEAVVAAPAQVTLRPARVAHLLGVAVAEERIDAILTGFGLAKTADGAWQVPSFRADLTREVDLIEEVARVVGMEIIPSKTQARFLSASATDKKFDREMVLRRALVAQGLHEARTVTLVPAQPLGVAYTQVAEKNLQRVKNPMIDDQVVLRPNLLHGLLSALKENQRAGEKSVRLFEIGRVFSTQKPEEFSHAALVISGPLSSTDWRTQAVTEADLFALKGILTATLGAGVSFTPVPNPALALSLSVEVGGKAVGFAGQLWPKDARELDSVAPVLFAEIDLVALAKAEGQAGVAKKYREIPRFPAVTRDIALLAPLTLAHAQIDSSLRSANEPLLAGVELFDVFTDATGAKIPADKRSLAYSLTYRSSDRTLTTDEVNAAHAKLKDRLKTQLGVSLRE